MSGDVTYYRDSTELKYGDATSPTDIRELTVGGVTIGGEGVPGGRIIANKIVGGKGLNPSAISINGATFADGGAITATGLKLGTDYDVKEKIDKNIENITTNKNALQALTEDGGRISSLEGRVGTNETNIVALETKTANLSANGKKLTNMEEVSATKLAVGGKEITADTVAGYDAAVSKTANITYDAATKTTYINEGTAQQVVIDEKGLKVGKNTSRMNDITGFATSKNLYVGTTDANNPTAADSKFFVDGATGETVVNGTGGKTIITGGGVTIDSAVGNQHVLINSGTVNATTSVISPYFYVDSNNEFKNNSLKVGNGTNGVTIADGKITTTGNATVGGTLDVTGEATFANGIKTNKISENTDGEGVKVDDVLLKDGGITATGNVKTTGDIQGKDITATGALKGASLNVTNDATVGGTLGVTGNITGTDITATGVLKGGSLNVTGNATVGGTLGVTGNITGADITANGALSGASLNVTNDATVGGTLDVTGDTTVKGNLAVDKNIKGQSLKIGTTGDEFTVDALGNVAAKGQLTAKSATIGTVGITNTGVVTGVSKLTTTDLEVTGLLNISGNIAAKDISGDSLTVTGAIKGASLDVTGAVTGATINGATITTDSFNGAKIGATTFNGVTLTTDGDVSGRNMTATGTIKGNEITDGAGASMKAGTVTGTKITDGVGFTATGGNVTANDIKATTGTIAGVNFAANNVNDINNLTASGTIQGATLKVNDHNLLDSNGLKADQAVIDNLTIDGASITSNNPNGSVGIAGVTVNNAGALNNVTSIDGVSVGAVTGGNGLEFGGNAVIGATDKPFSSNGFKVDGDGNVTGKSFKVNGSNYLDSTGLTTEKAVIGSVNTLNDQGIDTSGKLHVGGKATFGDSTGTHTTINGGTITSTDGTDSTTIGPNKITTKTLDVEDIILRNEMKDGAGNTITIKGSDGSMSVAGGKFAVDDKGQMTNEYTGYDAAGRATKTTLKTSVDGINANYTNSGNHNNNNLLNINQDGVALGVTDSSNNNLGMLSADAEKATMGYGTANSIVVDKNTIKSALGTDVTRVMTNSTTEQSIVDKVGAASRSLKADEIVDVAGGMTITTNNTGTTFSDGTTNTLIKGSAITSTNVTATGTATGVLDGSNLTLTNGANFTALTAGGATFTGATGEKGSPITTINGGTITTDTLNVDRINLGGEVIDKGAAGVEINSKLYMDAQGNFRAAEGNFTVKGGTGTDRGALHNKVGNTSFDTTETGASMKYNNGTVESNVSVGDNSAMVSAGLSSIEVKNDGITNNGKTTFKGAVDATVPTSETTIDGNTIKTGHLITDKLTITGSGNADGTGSTTGSIAFGGNGSITSNIKDGTKEATFKTDEKGTFTEAKDSAGNKTTNTVNAQGNTNEVTDGTNTSTATQTATSIGGVVTNGTVKMSQELTADGVKFEQTGYDEVNIAKGDVTVKNNRNTATPNQEVHLSDLGSLNNLDGELAARDEYTDNKTAVGAINAEAGIRREEVTRLDGRINDVNDRVNKVGAMAAAIASLKSIGYDPQAPSEFSIGLGQYKGETGVAMGFFHYPNKNFMINVSLSTAGGETMGGIGATWRFGHKSPQKLLEEQREEQAKKELAAAEKYQAAAKLAKEAQERAEYAAKLARQAQVSADNAKAAADATQAKHFG